MEIKVKIKGRKKNLINSFIEDKLDNSYGSAKEKGIIVRVVQTEKLFKTNPLVFIEKEVIKNE